MKRIAVCCLFAVLIATTSVRAEPPTADTIFTNGNVYTVDAKRPRAQAVAVKDGKILAVGTSAEVARLTGKSTRVVDLRGATVVPGLTDAHCHLAGIGAREITLNLEGTASVEDLLARVKARVERAAPGAWVTGRGWIETFWSPPVFPTRQQLDAVSPKNPVYLVRADGHGAVANTAALKIAAIDRNTKAPFGGEIMKDKATGEPNGMLLDRARELLTRHIPQPTEAEKDEAVLLGVKRSLSLGWCEIQNAGTELADAARIERLYADGKIKLRVYNAVYGPGANAAPILRDGAKVGAYGGRFTQRTIKVVMDGALGSKGAALLAPYADEHDSSGFLTTREEDLFPMLVAALERGIQVETHAIGDRANRVTLDLYERAFAAVPPAKRAVREPRWRVEHAQILHPDDLPRFARLGVIASMQPSHAIGDLYFAPSRVGLERLAGAYAWSSLLKTGAVVVGGSDAPVERGEPMIEFYAAVARKDMKGKAGPGWHPEEAVTREQALKMFTISAAYAAFEENSKGSIEVGKLADLTVLSADVMTIPEAEILTTRCLMTVVGGDVAYEAPAEKAAGGTR